MLHVKALNNTKMTINFEDPLFNINFVKAVENRPCIWNSHLSEYSKRTNTEKAWQEVAEEVKDSVSNCRERWRNIRGSFLRWQKQTLTGSRSKTKKKYYLADYLEFILPYTKTKASTGNLEILLDYSDNFEDTHSESKINTANTDLLIENVPNKMQVVKKQKVSQDSSLSNHADDEDFEEWLKSKTKHVDFNKEDPNMSFFRSLLPDVKKMTDKQNRRFRQKVIGLIDEILEDI